MAEISSNEFAMPTSESRGRTSPQQLSEQTHQVIDRTGDAMHQATDRAASKVDDLMQAEARMLEACKTYVREQPVMALGIAAATGFILSRLTR